MGDDLRLIDWKATARAGAYAHTPPLIRVRLPEQEQLVDKYLQLKARNQL